MKAYLFVGAGLLLAAGTIALATHFVGAPAAAPAPTAPSHAVTEADATADAEIDEDAAPPAELHVPRAELPIKLDGELGEAAWETAARTGAFVRAGDGLAARPFSEARLIWRDDTLFVALHATDDDIRTADTAPGQEPMVLADAFNLLFQGTTGQLALDVSADGKLVTRKLGPRSGTWNALPTAAHAANGTPNDPSDEDEQWVVELAVPLHELGLRGEKGERMQFAARRCDTPKNQRRTCAAWGAAAAGTLILD